MRFIITRHGETIGNLNNILQGQLDGTLSEKGILQAKKLAERFKNEKIDVIYSSNLKRAVDTAKEILKFHPELKLNLDKRVCERYWGECQGKPYPEGWDFITPLPGCETDKEFFLRAKDFIKEIYSKHKDEVVLVVCHMAIKTVLLCTIFGKSSYDLNIANKLTNTSVSIVDIEEDNKHKVHVIGCTKHLE